MQIRWTNETKCCSLHLALKISRVILFTIVEPSKSDSNTNTLLDDHHKRNKRGFWKNLWHGITNFAKGTACIVTLGLACESADRGHGTVVVQPGR